MCRNGVTALHSAALMDQMGMVGLLLQVTRAIKLADV